MSEFQLTITKRVPNPDYAEQMKELRSRNYYGSQHVEDVPRQYLDLRVLDVTVPEETFNAIRKAALETL